MEGKTKGAKAGTVEMRHKRAMKKWPELQALFPVAGATPEAEAAAKPVKSAVRTAKTAVKSKPVGNGGDSPHIETLKARLAELRSSGFNRLYQQGKCRLTAGAHTLETTAGVES